MGSLEKRLQAMEMELVDSLIVGALVRAEIQEMLAVLEASDDIEPPLYEKVARIVEGAGNDAG
jgi:tRNA isopentenyl-2-thiomethyl-A-37 hydroxylase MiaE